MKTVFIAGATGYLGRHLCQEYSQRGWYVTALVRDRTRAHALPADALIEAKATEPASLLGVMEGADLVVSALGITRQKDGLRYRDVDYQANLNLLAEAQRAEVKRFAYVHVLNADRMQNVALVQAKSAFVRALQAAPLPSTVIAPTGYFSDMADFLDMAKTGRVWLFGNGDHRMNPIHGADLAAATADAIERGAPWQDIGGPETFTHADLARLALRACGKPERITYLPDTLRKTALAVLPHLTPQRLYGAAQFFLTAMGEDMIAPAFGTRRLEPYFQSLLEQPE